MKGKKRRKRLQLFPLRAVLASRGMTMYRLAKETGMTHAAIGDLASGKRHPKWENVLLIAEKLGVELNAFEPRQYDAREPKAHANGEGAAVG